MNQAQKILKAKEHKRLKRQQKSKDSRIEKALLRQRLNLARKVAGDFFSQFGLANKKRVAQKEANEILLKRARSKLLRKFPLIFSKKDRITIINNLPSEKADGIILGLKHRSRSKYVPDSCKFKLGEVK